MVSGFLAGVALVFLKQFELVWFFGCFGYWGEGLLEVVVCVLWCVFVVWLWCGGWCWC